MGYLRPIHFTKLAKYTRFALTHCRVHGFGASAAVLCRELLFDLRHGVDTTTPQDLDLLDVPESARKEAVQYQGADPKLVLELFDLLSPERKNATFVDYGCGKGRVLVLAAQHGFKKLIGVEFSPELSLICDRNLSRASGLLANTQISINTIDAALFIPPHGPVLAFFYNPFSGATLAAVVQQLRSKALQSADPVTIVYVNPCNIEVFSDHGFRVTHRLQNRGHTTGVVADFPGTKLNSRHAGQ